MFWSILGQILSFLVDFSTNMRRSDKAKDLEIIVLRHQLRVLQRRLPHPPRSSRWEKLCLTRSVRKLSLAGVVVFPHTTTAQRFATYRSFLQCFAPVLLDSLHDSPVVMS